MNDDPLSWYLEMAGPDRRKAFDLITFLYPEPQTCIQDIIPEAVSVGMHVLDRVRINGQNPKAWRTRFSRTQCFYLGILQVLLTPERWGALPPEHHTLSRRLSWYLACLASCTLHINPFYIAMGFEGILSNGTPSQLATLFTSILGIAKMPNDIGKRTKSITQAFTTKFSALVQVDSTFGACTCSAATAWHRSYHQKSAKGKGEAVPELEATAWHLSHINKTHSNLDFSPVIYHILNKLLLWSPPHLSNIEAEARQAIITAPEHTFLDHEHCLPRVQQWDRTLAGAFSVWNLPCGLITEACGKGKLPQPDDQDPSADEESWQALEQTIMEKILWRHWKQTHRQSTTARYVILVDGQRQGTLAPGQRGVVAIPLPASSQYVEIRGDAGDMVVNCPLMAPEDLPPQGWESIVELASGDTLRFLLLPPATQKLSPYANALRSVSGLIFSLFAGKKRLPTDTPSEDELGLTLQVQLQAPSTDLLAAAPHWWQRLLASLQQPAYAMVALLFASSLLVGGTYVTSRWGQLRQLEELQQQLHFDNPFTLELVPVGPRSLQLALSFYPDVVQEIWVDWGDPTSPDPVGGTQIYQISRPEGGVVGAEKVVLPPITHAYGPVPQEGLRSTVSLRIVPGPLPETRPETLTADKLSPQYRILVLPYGVIVHPPEAELRILAPSAGEIITPMTEIHLQARALTGDVHLLAVDPDDPRGYQYLGKLPPPPFGGESTLSRVIATSQLPVGVIKLVALSSDQLTAQVGDVLEWRAIPPTSLPLRAEVDVRQAGMILSPRPGAMVSGIEPIRAQVALANTYVAAVLCPAQAARACVVQNSGQLVVPYTEFALNVHYMGRDRYALFLGLTAEPELFKEGAVLAQRPLVDREGRQVHWIGPVAVEEQ